MSSSNLPRLVSYGFRLTGVDGMGFLQIQDLREGSSLPEPASEPYWINKDIVREIHEIDLANAKVEVRYTGKSVAPEPEAKPKVEPEPPREVTPKMGKAKLPKAKTALKQKPALN
jgi:hypothetical protein